ncbi:hypothetical protein [Nonomuraea jabiensis]|uniref:Putative amidohydrolase YtcJ n=1 Tax=Nonomuraea jabiensis TaxID=882448 RepID=A0A7W9G831_9ACTN|nr:hypothetical protein [Nonomuraea jabiensis]MBB5778851.1 putative amidohydrolase YtcJ [Nonomuraea jabiensis]
MPVGSSRLRGVRVFDGERTVPAADVVIDGDRIGTAAGAVDAVIDGAGKTLLPGLIDAHTHAFEGDLAEALTFRTLDTVADPGEAKAFVEARLAEGVDYLKIAIDDGGSSSGAEA